MTSPDDLTARVRAAVQQRLDLARAAADVANPEEWTADLAYDGWRVRTIDGYEMHVGAEELALHIATNDPATVERHCLADLRRLERHTLVPRRAFQTAHCGWCDIDTDWPCPDIRDLAEAYAIDLAIASGEERQ